MTKRTAEQTLRDEIDRANREYSKATDDYERARGRLNEAKSLLDTAYGLMQSARQKVLRSEAALEALLPAEPTLRDIGREPGIADADPESVMLDRDETIAKAVGVDVETVRAASGKAKA